MQSWTGVLSGGLLHYHFDINSEYGEAPVFTSVVISTTN